MIILNKMKSSNTLIKQLSALYLLVFVVLRQNASSNQLSLLLVFRWGEGFSSLFIDTSSSSKLIPAAS